MKKCFEYIGVSLFGFGLGTFSFIWFLTGSVPRAELVRVFASFYH